MSEFNKWMIVVDESYNIHIQYDYHLTTQGLPVFGTLTLTDASAMQLKDLGDMFNKMASDKFKEEMETVKVQKDKFVSIPFDFENKFELNK